MSPIDVIASWAWQSEDGTWNLFPDEVQKALKQKCVKQKTATFSLDLTGSGISSSVKLDFESMHLKKAKKTWKVCCCTKDSDKFYTWSRDYETGDRMYFSASNTAELDRATKAGELTAGCVFKAGDISEVDLTSFVVCIAGSEWKVHREEIQLDKGSAAVSLSDDDAVQCSPPKRAKLESKAKGSRAKPDKPKGSQKVCKEPAMMKSKAKLSATTPHEYPIDQECTELKDKAIIYVEGSEVYDVMLNQTNLQFNNNKFMALQVIKETNKENYYAWFRWGRVGRRGQTNLVNCGNDKEKAKALFVKKFQDKTKNSWQDLKRFKKQQGKYDLVHMASGTKKYCLDDVREQLATDEEEDRGEEKPSELAPALQDLMSYISSVSDVKKLQATIGKMHYDFVKAPLGSLTEKQVQMGYKALRKIESCIKGNNRADLLEACNQFYTRIPHDFGMKTPPIITTLQELSEKVKLLEALSDVQVAMELMRKERELKKCHPLDMLYLSLGCSLTMVDHADADYELISKYVKNTHGDTHTGYKLSIVSIHRVCRESEADNFRKLQNRMLLWHGSRASNWAGILSQGLRIAPPEAPVTGYMFGKGVYFSDCVSKSANYCFSHRYNNKGLLVLSEVSLGKSKKLYDAAWNEKPPSGHHSVMGMGRNIPDPEEFVTMSDGVLVPCGKLVAAETPKDGNCYTLLYNEYIVYNTSQIKMKYLVWVDFENIC